MIKKVAGYGAVLIAFCLSLIALSGGKVLAADNSDFTQVINAGTLTTDILDSSRNPVANPSVAMSSKGFSFDCQSGGSASTGTFGTNDERPYVINGDAADNGWTLTIAATGGATTVWSDGGSNTFDFNDAGGSGCTDGVDADSKGGQMTLDPSVGTLTADCSSCTTANVTKGSSTAYSEGVTDTVTLLNAAAASDDVWRGYLTGTSVSQTIPAEQPAASYTINLTLTATAT